MAARKKRDEKTNSNGALGFEAKLWEAADKLRGHMDAAEYKHVVLGLVFLKYISDAFEERRKFLLAAAAEPKSEYFIKEPTLRYGITEDRDEYSADNVFWVPEEARWEKKLQSNARKPTIGTLIDNAMEAVEKANPTLKGVLPKDYGRSSLDKTRLGELVDVVSGIGLGDAESRSKDIIGRVYEYFLGRFASAEESSAASSTRRAASSRCSSRCSSPSRGACTTRAAARAGCSSRARSSCSRMVGGSATSASTDRSRTRRLGASAR